MKLFSTFAISALAEYETFESGSKHIPGDLANNSLDNCPWFGPGVSPATLAQRMGPNQDRVLNPDRIIDPDRIINGKDAEHGSWPWIVGFTENGQRVCAGTIIHDRWIISAEHCFPQHIAKTGTVMKVEDFPAIGWTKMYFGDHNKRREEDSEFFLTPQKLVFMPNRSPNGRTRDTTAADIVLIQVESITNYMRENKLGSFPNVGAFVKPACLPNPDVYKQTENDHFAGKHCWIAGWGYTRFGETWWGMGGSKLASIVQEAGINVFSNKYCVDHSHMTAADNQEDVTSSAQLQTYNEFCAGVPDNDGNGKTDGDVDACSGDSGGPLICDVDGAPVLVGITSRGKGCAMEDNPGIYTPTWPYYDWIVDTIAAETPNSNGNTDGGNTDGGNTDGGDTEGGDEGNDDDDVSDDELTNNGEEFIIDDNILEIIAERCVGTPFCKKPNGQDNPNKTKAQGRARTKKLNQLKKAVVKYIGDNKSDKPCMDEDADIPTLIDYLDDKSAKTVDEAVDIVAAEPVCYTNLDIMIADAIAAVYDGCKPHPNWIRATKKKAAALQAFEDKAAKMGCTIE